MKPCLVDVNVLLALLVRHHEHHDYASQWYDGLSAGEAVLCRFVQLAVMRLLGNKTIMGEFAMSASSAWQVIGTLMEDERMTFADEPAALDSIFPKLLRYPRPTSKLVGDAYLAAFSITGQMRFATIDQGFDQFRGIDLEPIVPEA